MSRTWFINGRILAEGKYDLDECPTHETLESALIELMVRVHESPDIAPHLQTLIFEADGERPITYKPVSSGQVAQVIMSIRNQQ